MKEKSDPSAETTEDDVLREEHLKQLSEWERYLLTRKPIIALDGYIPNSVVRSRIGYVPPKETEPPWSLKPVPEINPKHLPEGWKAKTEDYSFSAMTDIPGGSGSAHKRRTLDKMQVDPSALNKTPAQRNMSKELSERTDSLSHLLVELPTPATLVQQLSETEELGLLQSIVNEPWFPKSVAPSLEPVMDVLLTFVDEGDTNHFSLICDYIVAIGKEIGLPREYLRRCEESLGRQTSHNEAAIRQKSQWALRQLGFSRNDVKQHSQVNKRRSRFIPIGSRESIVSLKTSDESGKKEESIRKKSTLPRKSSRRKKSRGHKATTRHKSGGKSSGTLLHGSGTSKKIHQNRRGTGLSPPEGEGQPRIDNSAAEHFEADETFVRSEDFLSNFQNDSDTASREIFTAEDTLDSAIQLLHTRLEDSVRAVSDSLTELTLSADPREDSQPLYGTDVEVETFRTEDTIRQAVSTLDSGVALDVSDMPSDVPGKQGPTDLFPLTSTSQTGSGEKGGKNEVCINRLERSPEKQCPQGDDIMAEREKTDDSLPHLSSSDTRPSTARLSQVMSKDWDKPASQQTDRESLSDLLPMHSPQDLSSGHRSYGFLRMRWSTKVPTFPYLHHDTRTCEQSTIPKNFMLPWQHGSRFRNGLTKELQFQLPALKTEQDFQGQSPVTSAKVASQEPLTKNSGRHECDYIRLARKKMHHFTSISRHIANKQMAEMLVQLGKPCSGHNSMLVKS